VNDQLKDSRGWWILEVLWPIKVRILHKNREDWVKKVRLNLGRYRPIRESEPRMHWTVQHRRDAGKYDLRVRSDKNTNWVEAV